MTLTDEIENDADNRGAATAQYLMDVGNAVLRTIEKAKLDGRVSAGVYTCAEVLERCPEQVMLCLLPNSGPVHDVTIDIEHTLIEAHCLENDVRVIKVNNTDRLRKCFQNTDEPDKENQIQDLSCVLIQYPLKSNGDPIGWKQVEGFCRKKMWWSDGSQSPSVQIPD